MSDGRVPLEFDSITNSQNVGANLNISMASFSHISGDSEVYILKFFYPTKYKQELLDDIKPYKDKLYSNMTTYEVNHQESVLTLRSMPIDLPKRQAMALVKKILKTDNEALLNTMHPCETIKQVASFKIKVFKKTKFTVDDLFNLDPDEELFYGD